MAAPFYLEFEKPIVELEKKIEELNSLANNGLDIGADVSALEARVETMRADIFSNLSRWQTAQVARHINRPFTLDYINLMFTDFTELHGDRNFGDDHAIVGGLARFNDQPVMVIGHQKGRDTKEKVYRNFGMPNPEGYRKALRLMQMAEQFKLPVITFVDTPAPIPASARKNADRPKRSPGTCARWPACAHRSLSASPVKAVRAAHWRLPWA